MPTFFGNQTQDTSDTPGGGSAILVANAAAISFACPGTGNQNIQELSCLVFGSSGTYRVGIYTTAGVLVAEGTSAITLTGASLAWRGHLTQADVKAAGGSSPGVLTGGTSYRFAVAFSAGDPTLGATRAVRATARLL